MTELGAVNNQLLNNNSQQQYQSIASFQISPHHQPLAPSPFKLKDFDTRKLSNLNPAGNDLSPSDLNDCEKSALLNPTTASSQQSLNIFKRVTIGQNLFSNNNSGAFKSVQSAAAAPTCAGFQQNPLHQSKFGAELQKHFMPFNHQLQHCKSASDPLGDDKFNSENPSTSSRLNPAALLGHYHKNSTNVASDSAALGTSNLVNG